MMDENAQCERNIMETHDRAALAVTHSDFSRLNIRKTESADIGPTGEICRDQLADGRRGNG
jgi:hypothetical protein